MSQRETQSTPLAARYFGEGLPVLFVHGWMLDGSLEAADFEPIFSKLKGYRRIYVDLPGMGATRSNSIQDLDHIFDNLCHFIEQKISSEKFLLAGSSCGGYIARALATRYSSQILGVLLRVPLIHPNDGGRDLDDIKPIVHNEAAMVSIPPDLRRLLGNVIIQTAEYIEKLSAKMRNLALPAIKAAQNDVLDPIRNDPGRYRLELVESGKEEVFLQPSLIIVGRQDGVVGYRDSFRLLELYPRATFVILDRGTHDLPIDEEGVFEACVIDWLKRVEENMKHG